MTFKHALVTGGAGFIGSHLCRELLSRGLEVTVLDNLSTGKADNIPDGAELVEGNILDAPLVGNVMKKRRVDVVFHQAARVTIRDSVKNFQEDASQNIMGTLNILRLCLENGVRKMVYASSMAVYADSEKPEPVPEEYSLEPISPYGISKLAGEKYCLLMTRGTGLSCTVLRYFNTFGIGQTYTPYVGVITIFIHRLLEVKSLQIFGDGGQCRDFIHVSDVVRANILAMGRDLPTRVFNIGSGRSTSVLEVARILRDKLAPEVEIHHVDPHEGELRNSIADISRAVRELGFRPERRLEESIDEIIQWYRENRSVSRDFF